MIVRKIGDIYLKVIPFRNTPDRTCFGSSKIMPFFLHHLRDLEPLIPFLHRGPAVIPVDAFLLVWAAAAVRTFIDCHRTDISVPVAFLLL